MTSPDPGASTGPTALDEYVRRPDPAFAWSVDDEEAMTQGRVTRIAMTSQAWHGAAWGHRLQVYEPARLEHPGPILLFLTGGSNGEGLPRRPQDDALAFELAGACGGRVAVLAQVPNQPLLGGLAEDALIAETFVRCLDTGDATWPILLPMVKSAVRAMDALQQWDRVVDRFVLSGASKRGWTAWLAAAVDPRVAAIAPVVIDTLNMKAQTRHAREVWGRQSEQIDDYTRRGLTEAYETGRGDALWKLVDPYHYRERIAVPKLLIQATNDPFWVLDAMNLYWDDLAGPSRVVYIPGAGHDLAAHREYFTHGVGACFRHAALSRPLPGPSWVHGDAGPGAISLEASSSAPPRSARVWTARAPTRDFRQSAWSPRPWPLAGAGFAVEMDRPGSGFLALFGDLEYEIEGLPFHLSTQVRIAGPRDA